MKSKPEFFVILITTTHSKGTVQDNIRPPFLSSFEPANGLKYFRFWLRLFSELFEFFEVSLGHDTLASQSLWGMMPGGVSFYVFSHLNFE